MSRLRQLAVALAVAGGLLAVAFGIQPARSGGTSPPPGDPPPLAATGRSLFEARCSSCHGAAGAGTDRAPSLIGVGAAAADFELRTGRMPFSGPPGGQAQRKPPAFDDGQIEALVAYVSGLGAGPAIPEPQLDDALLSDGQRAYVANCAPCHGATANGGAVGGGALAPPLNQATSVQVAEAMLVGPGQMPVFSGLSGHDRDAVVTYLAYLRTARNPGGFSIGGIGPVPEGFVGWVVGMGLMLVVVVLIGREWGRAGR